MSERSLRSGALILSIVALFGLTACATTTTTPAAPEPAAAPTPVAEAPAAPAGPTLEEARQFITDAENHLLELGVASNHASWVQQNFITYDTQIVSAAANERFITAGVDYAKKAARYDNVAGLTDVEKRKLARMKLFLTAPAPSDPAKTKELATLAARLDAMYGEGKWCPKPNECMDIEQITDVMANSRDPKRLLEVWRGWHTISPAMRSDYARFVQLSNEGARELGHKDTGAMWRSKYDMPPDAFAQELDRLWGQVKPLYNSLHCYVRFKLGQKYGTDVVPQDKPIPAHLLGNIWAQEWGNIYDVVAPPKSSTGYDIAKALKAKKTTELDMVHYGENFFSSLGFAPLPETFWQRSLFTKPRDREVVCHASAWDLNEVDDLRIKMCIDITAEDFQTIHHELGHNYYQRAYNQQPYLFRDSANDGFHEAVGDTIALSITPSYLKQVGLITKEPPASADIPLLLREAMDKIAFLPFGLLIDQWRWKVFSGEIAPEDYNKGWWELRTKYQGIAPTGERGEEFFDAGAKYHIPGNTPYTRYFLARLLQFQFHRDLCKIAGYEGPLNRCTIYGSKEAGKALNDMLAMGASRPWPEALAKLSGSGEMDATAIIDYFAPLKTWLDTQNQGKTCGW